MLAFGAEHEAVEPVRLADGIETVATAGQELVHIGLVADVENEAVGRCVENGMKRNRQLNHAEVGSEMTARLGEHRDEFLPDFLGEGGKLLQREFF